MGQLLAGSTILVVDDDARMVDVLARMLRSEGADCITAETVAGARLQLAGGAPIDVVITDLNMPGESGVEFVKSLADARAELGVIVASGEDDPGLASRLIDLGIYGYLTKPFRKNDLVIGVRSALQRRALLLANRDAVDIREQAFHRDTITRLSTVAELRDLDTGQHIMRMSEYSAVIARAYGLPESQVELIRVASPMHDVGKIGIPDSILLKPGPLTPEERETMQQHAKIGHDILANSKVDLLRLGARLALTHHERYDGSGYPHGLRGDQIPIEARIVAVADVFDALTSDRVYRPGFPLGDAVEMMRAERGKHFDPGVFDAFLLSLPALIPIEAGQRVQAKQVTAA